jgi:hypothetical protein
MKTIRIAFTHTAFRLIFEDDALADNFYNTFRATNLPAGRRDHTIEIMGKEYSRYSVRLNGKLLRKDLLRDEAAYCVTRIFGDEICACVSAPVCVMHAASVLTSGGIVSFCGASGSGKTSLSLFFSEYGSYVGDEYAFLDIETGCLRHEQHPFQLKESNASLLIPSLASPSVLAVKGEPFGWAYYVSLAFTNRQETLCTDRSKVAVIVFPHFDRNRRHTVINKFHMPDLPSVVLQSLMGQSAPSLLLGQFIKMAARERLRFLELWFSDGADAAEKLHYYIKRESKE